MRVLLAALAAAGALLPLSVMRVVCVQVAKSLWLASPSLRRRLDQNARHLLGDEASPGRRRRLALAQLGGFGQLTAEIAAMRLRSAGMDDLLAGVEGTEFLGTVVEAGEGMVAVTLHFGNYELAAAALARKTTAGVSVVYQRDASRGWEERRVRWREASGVGGIAIDSSPYFGVEALTMLRRGGAVLLAGDQVAGQAEERIPFFGAPASFSTLPARLAIASGAPLLPAFSVRQADGRYTLHMEAPIDSRGRDARELTEELVKVYERYLRKYPEQWLMLRDFWAEGP